MINLKHNRFVRLTLILALLAAFVFAGTASAAPADSAATPAQAATPCIINTTTHIPEAGMLNTESSFADVIQVECSPRYSESTVTIESTQLNNSCIGTLSWSAVYPYAPVVGSAITATLDNEGNATVVAWGGPSCVPGRDLITASLNAPPYSTASTTVTVMPPLTMTPGVKAYPASLVEDNVFSAAATVIMVSFSPTESNKFVNITSQELFSRCGGSLTWVGPDEVVMGTGTNTTTVQLDDNGNAFVVALAGPNCAAGTSTIVADLASTPYTTYTTTFTVQAPRPTR